MKTAVIYARVSTSRQAEEGVSMESQIEQCRAKAAALGAEVVQVFRDDGVSGRTDRRPGFMAAMAYCAAHPVQFFVCWSTSRFGRNLADALKNTSQLREWGTRPAFVHQDVDLETDEGWMLSVVTGMMDEVYSRNVARDTLRSMITASRDGYWVGGKLPFGYRVEKEGRRSRLVIDDAEAETVRRAFELALEGLGAQAIALRLNAAGLLRRGAGWAKNTVHGLLTNPTYMGVRRYNAVNRKRRERKDAAEVVEVKSHPAIVEQADFERVQAMVKDRAPERKGGGPRSAFVFTGLLRCGLCGGALQIRNGTARNGELRNYYACLAHKYGANRCGLKTMRAEEFDAWMVQELLTKVMTPEVVERVVGEVKQSGAQWAAERDARRKALVRDLRDAEGRRGKLYDVLELQGRNAPNLGDLTARLRELRDQIQGIEGSLAALESDGRPDYAGIEIDPAEAAEAIRETFRRCTDAKALRAVVGTFVMQITVTDDLVVVKYREDAMLGGPEASAVPVRREAGTGSQKNDPRFAQVNRGFCFLLRLPAKDQYAGSNLAIVAFTSADSAKPSP